MTPPTNAGHDVDYAEHLPDGSIHASAKSRHSHRKLSRDQNSAAMQRQGLSPISIPAGQQHRPKADSTQCKRGKMRCGMTASPLAMKGAIEA